MRKLCVFESISVDGYFCDAGGGMSWAHAGRDGKGANLDAPANPATDALIPNDKKRINPVDPANISKQVALDMNWYADNYGAALDAYTKIISA